MKKRFILIAGFIGVYLLFLLVLMPASTVIQWVSLPNKLQLNSVSGSIWHSQISAVKFEDFVVNNVEVELNAFSLLMLDPKLDVSFGGALVSGPEGNISVNGLLSTLRLSDGNISLLAKTISRQLNLPVPINAHEFIDVSINEFISGKAICQTLTGKIDWPKAAITALEQKIQLGKLGATLSCQQGDVVLELLDNNDLGLSFITSIGQGFSTSGSGYLQPNDKTPDAIQQVLPFLGKPDNQGRYRLRF